MSASEQTYPDFTGLTFEKVWAMFQESDRKFQETERLLKETLQESDRKFQETERLLKETLQETDKQIAALSKSVGDVGNRLGEVAEHLVAPGIVEKFNELGFNFTDSSVDLEIKDPETKQVCLEIDILLENGKNIVVIEVKTKPTLKDVQRLTERIVLFRQHRDNVFGKEKRTIFGAIAGAIFPRNVKESAGKAGFFIITQKGDTMQIENPVNFKPKAF